MLPKIHFGKKSIQRIVKFNDACYYPLLFSDMNVHRAFGLSYGFPEKDSISIGWRPSETKLDKIDLFAIIYKNGTRDVNYFFTVDTNEYYALKFKINKDNPLISFYVFDVQSGEKISNEMYHYEMPLMPIGCILNSKNESMLNKNIDVHIEESDFDFGKN